ncbi:MAG: cell division ATP-binding protein FtsE [Candidatus Paceibacterota bacterium]
MIVFKNVSKSYKQAGRESIALDKVSFKIQPNEFVSIVGRSGAGKSTIIRLLVGEEKPSEGRVFFGSYEVDKLKPNELPDFRRNIGVVFQDFRLLSQKTAFENIAFVLEVEGYAQNEINKIVPKVLELVGMDDKMTKFPAELSGGEKQRIAIARAMINKPEVIIADEPTGNLDPMNKWEVVKLLNKINELGSTIILATHDKEIVNNLGQRVITLEGGKLIKDEANGKFVL